MSESLSNALCRLATGGGFATRELFTDEGEIIFDSQRPVILNGISEVVSRSDLLDRAILVYLPRIPKNKRKLGRIIDREFAAAQPRILGALLDAVGGGLRQLKNVKIDELPRMADFAEWVAACEEGLKLEDGSFLKAYGHNQEKANGLAIEASPVAQAIVAFVDKGGDWQGVTGALLKALNDKLEADNENPKTKHSWPQSPRGLGAKLKEVAPNLRRGGIKIHFGERTRQGCVVTLKKSEDQSEEGSDAGKDVHNVHDVHQANRINGLDREHLDPAVVANVHTNVHTVNHSKQRGGEHREHCEHLFPAYAADNRPDWQKSIEPIGADGEPLPF